MILAALLSARYWNIHVPPQPRDIASVPVPVSLIWIMISFGFSSLSTREIFLLESDGFSLQMETERAASLGYVADRQTDGNTGICLNCGPLSRLLLSGGTRKNRHLSGTAPTGGSLMWTAVAAFGEMGGRLGCLCLETGEEYYESSLQDYK